MSRLFDPGLQPERTELTWRRTSLSLAIGSLIAMRLLPVSLGDPRWIAVGIAGVLLSAVLWFAARTRYRTVTRLLARDGDRARLPGGSLLAVVAGLVAVSGFLALAAVVGLIRGM